MTYDFDFTEVMKTKSDSDLVEIVTKLRDDYQLDAIVAAETELKIRNISPDNIEHLKSEIEQKHNKKSQNEIDNDEGIQRIYSKRAIFVFSILFTTIFGGVLLMQNHKDTGNKKIANQVLTFSILYTIIAIIILYELNANKHLGMTYLVNAVGAIFLTELFYSKYFPIDKYFAYKKIWKPLIISIIIVTVPFLLGVLYSIRH